MIRNCSRTASSIYQRSWSCARTFAQSKVPDQPTWNTTEAHKDSNLDNAPKIETEITPEMVNHLERLALVDFRSEEGVERLATAVKFADQLRTVDTSSVQPMTTVLEYWPLYLRDDRVMQGDARTILKNAQRLDEDYFVAPPGNIPLKQQDTQHNLESDND